MEKTTEIDYFTHSINKIKKIRRLFLQYDITKTFFLMNFCHYKNVGEFFKIIENHLKILKIFRENFKKLWQKILEKIPDKIL